MSGTSSGYGMIAWSRLQCMLCIFKSTVATHLCDCVVRSTGGLQPLDTRDAHTDMRRLDHADVISTVTDG